MTAKEPEDYIPEDIWDEAKEFVFTTEDSISIYKMFRNLPNYKQNDEAEKFIAWWELGSFQYYPHSLILLYDALDDIYKTIGSDDVMNGYEQMLYKLVQFYRILKQNGMIND